ncbi:MAG: hypothetical protein JNL39_06130 [Opitutaceae bacterium]|nr:hypothetical protein [Opitutaceae bacterium]
MTPPRPFSLLLLFSTALAAAGSVAPAPHWWQLPPLPDRHGFACPFAGETRGIAIVAGGANFPERQLWEGGAGAKRWHDRVFVLEPGAESWRLAGRLPRPLGYGVSASTDTGVIIAGGGDAQRHYADVFALDWRDGQLVTRNLPPLPRATALCSGTRVGDTLYVTGGLPDPTSKSPLNDAFALDLRAVEKGWRRLPPVPGPGRHLAVAAALDGALHLFSGVNFEPDGAGGHRTIYLRDAYRLSAGAGKWERLPDLPHAAVAGANPAPTFAGEAYLIGGTDGALFGKPPQEFHQVPRRIQVYDPRKKAWREATQAPMARVAVSTIQLGDRWVLPSGEISAGVRSPEVWSIYWPAPAP